METVKQLREVRVSKVSTLETLQNKESLTDEEKTSFDSIMSEIKNLDLDITRAEEAEKIMSAAAGKSAVKGLSSSTKKELKNYSFMKAIREGATGNLTGLEAEMHQEANLEKKASGIYNESSVSIPSFLADKRALDVATDGTDLVAVNNASAIIPVLRPNPIVGSLGATIITGLVGDLDLPRQSSATAATWEGENDANAESTPGFNKLSLTPKRLGAYTEISKQLLAQRSPSVDALVRSDLEVAIGNALDVAAINGAGSGGVPEGILNVTGIGNVIGGTNGALPTFANMVALETAINSANADGDSMAYLTTPGIKGFLKTKVKEAGQASYVYEGNQINGYNAFTSTNVPSTLTKGTSSGNCHAIVFGNWRELILAQWAGVDIVVDPYSLSKNAKIQLVINAWYDVAVRHAASFSAMKDAKLA